MTSDDLTKLEQVAREAQARSPGPWRCERDHSRVDYIMDSSPRPDGYDEDDSGAWVGNRVVETDSGYYKPKGATADHIATFSPDVVLALIARVRELEAHKRQLTGSLGAAIVAGMKP
jgi:hypothetical protein